MHPKMQFLIENNCPNRKSIMKRAPMQPKFTIFWGSKAVYEKLSFDLFWSIFKRLKTEPWNRNRSKYKPNRTEPNRPFPVILTAETQFKHYPSRLSLNCFFKLLYRLMPYFSLFFFIFLSFWFFFPYLALFFKGFYIIFMITPGPPGPPDKKKSLDKILPPARLR